MPSTPAISPQPIEALRDDHRRASRLIRLLIEQLEGVAVLRHQDIEIAQDVLRYMVDFVDTQHHAREDFLIELLAKRDPTILKRIHQTNEDHDDLRDEGQKILHVLADLVRKQGTVGRSVLRRLNHYGETLLTHFQFEESKLFSLAETSLDKDDWKKIERMGDATGDPLFGEEVEADFKSLFDVYVNQVREIGSPLSSRSSAPVAAALVESTAAMVSGTNTIYSAMREGSVKLLKANLSGAASLAGSRSISDFWRNAANWSRSYFEEADTMRGEVFAAVHETATAQLEPFSNAITTRARDFAVSHRPDSARASWQARIVNLALRATVKRLGSESAEQDFEMPTQNIEVPKTAIERLIPELASDVVVARKEFASAFAEIITIKRHRAKRTVLFLPGGGFMMAPTQAHRLMAARLARKARARVVIVHYRLAPEYRFPAGLDDCVDAYRYLIEEGTSPDTISIMGDSAGGKMALSSLIRIRDEGLPLPASAVLLSPVTDLSYTGQSREDNSWADPSLPNDKRNIIAEAYLGDVPKDDPLASPLYADLSGLSPILIQVGSIEVLLDDALRVAAKIRAQGGDCECEVWHDMPHDWMLFGMLPEARKALRRIVGFIEANDAAPSVPQPMRKASALQRS